MSENNRTLEELQREYDILRYLLAKGSGPCVYCGLSRADMLKCESGFPGCARADDLMCRPPGIPD